MKPLHTLSDDELGAALQRALHELPDAPAALQRAAVNLWVLPSPSMADVAQAALRLASAVLRFDSWAAGQTAVAQGLRSGRSPTRHLLFSAEGRDVDLRIAPAAEAFALAGQILGPDEGGAVELAMLDLDAGGGDGGDGRLRRADIDALGEFRIDGLAAGLYAMTLKLGADQIMLPPLQVGEPAGDASA